MPQSEQSIVANCVSSPDLELYSATISALMKGPVRLQLLTCASAGVLDAKSSQPRAVSFESAALRGEAVLTVVVPNPESLARTVKF